MHANKTHDNYLYTHKYMLPLTTCIHTMYTKDKQLTILISTTIDLIFNFSDACSSTSDDHILTICSVAA